MKTAALKYPRLFFVCSMLGLWCMAPAQSSQSGGGILPQTDSLDAEWDSLRMAAYAQPAGDIENAKSETALKAALAKQALNFLRNADRAKSFYSKNPKHAKAGEARKLEVVLLIQAVQAGESSVEGRAESAALAFSTDKSLPESQRAEIAGVYGFTRLMRNRLQGDELQSALENTARSLILSFPSQPQGYESLLSIAAEAGEEKEKALLEELLKMPTPEAIKERARTNLERRALVGQSLESALTDAGRADGPVDLKPGRAGTLIYTWASWSPGSAAMAKLLAGRNLGGVNVLALNLDKDLGAAQEFAQKYELPGTRLYDARGIEGALAKRLKVSSAPQVYFIDAQGVIRDVRGTERFEQKLTQRGL